MKKYLHFLPAAGFYGLIFFLSSQSDLGVDMPVRWGDKVPHALEFAVMGFLLQLGFSRVLLTSTRLKIVLTFLAGTVLGILDEFHQKFVPGRVCDVRDAAADAVGVVLGIAAYWYFLRKKKRLPDA